MNKILSLLVIMCVNYTILGQLDSLTTLRKIRPYVVPSLFISSGVIINYTSSKFNKKNIQQNILGKYPNTNTSLDDYLPFVPVGQMYLGKIMGLKSKNNYFNQTKNMFLSQFFTGLITQGIKRTTNIIRPDGTLHSFPSGHTSAAFSSASTLFYEYKDNHPIYAASGYIFAGTTGGLRVLNNRHWVSDVFVGAGLAIVVTHLVYHFEPLKKWNPFKPKEQKTARLFY